MSVDYSVYIIRKQSEKGLSVEKKLVVESMLLSFLLFYGCTSLSKPIEPDEYQNERNLQASAFTDWALSQRGNERTFTVGTGHTGEVRSVAFSPDGRYVLTCSDDKTAKLWETASGRMIRTNNIGDINGNACFSPDGKQILAVTNSGLPTLYDSATGLLIKDFYWQSDRSAFTATSVPPVFSPDGKFFISGGEDNVALLWEIDSGDVIHIFEGHTSWISAVAFSPDGEHILTGSDDNTVRLWNLKNKDEVLIFNEHTDRIVSLAFSPDGKQFVTSSEDGTAILWDIKNIERFFTINSPRDVVTNVDICSAVFSPDGKQILLGFDDCSARLWDIESESEVKRFNTSPFLKRKNILAAFSPDGEYVLTGNGDNTATLWDLSSAEKIRTFTGTLGIKNVQYSKNGEYILSISSDNQAVLIDALKGKIIRTIPEDVEVDGHIYDFDKTAAVFSPDSRYILFGGVNGYFWLYEIATEEIIFHKKGFSDGDVFLAFSSDGNRFLAANSEDGEIQLRASSDSKLIKRYNTGIHKIDLVSFSSDDSFFYVNKDDEIYKYDNSGRLVLRNDVNRWDFLDSNYVKSIIDYPGSSQTLIGGRSNIGIWDLNSNTLIRDFRRKNGVLSGPCTCAAVSPDGKYVVGGFSGNIIQVWDISREEAGPLILEGHISSVTSLAFSSDSDHFISGSADGTIRYWNIETGENYLTILIVPDEHDERYVEFYDHRVLTWLPNGYYSGDESLAQERVCLVDGFTLYSINQFSERLYRPDLIISQISDRGNNDLVDHFGAFQQPPIVSVYIKNIDGDFELIGRTDECTGLSVNKIDNNKFPIKDGTVTVRVTAAENGGGIDSIRLYQGNKVLGDSQRGLSVVSDSQMLSREYVVPLASGENHIRAKGFSSDRTESATVNILISYIPPAVVRPDLYIISASADEYVNPKYNLNYTTADSLGVQTAIKESAYGLFEKVNIFSLQNENLSVSGLEQAFQKVIESSVPDDVFIFFYAGHGIALNESDLNQYFFVLPRVTQMTDREQLLSKGFSSDRLRYFLSEIKATKQLVLIDACNAGAATESFLYRGAAEEIALQKLARASGSAVLTATTDQQYASEIEELGHGIFTYALIEGLEGKASLNDGCITASSLRMWIDKQVPILSEKYNGNMQYPTTFMIGQDFPLGFRK